MSEKVTELQLLIIATIKAFFVENMKNPSVRELCQILTDENGKPKAPNAIQGHMNRLAAKGLLIMGEGKSRSYRVAGWNPFGGEYSRIGSNYAVNLIVGERVSIMLFSETGKVKSDIYTVESALKMADSVNAPSDQSPIDRIAFAASFFARKLAKAGMVEA